MRRLFIVAFYITIQLQVTAQNTIQQGKQKSPESESPLMFSNRPEKELFFSDKEFEINGHIENYVPDSNNRFISFRLYKILGPNRDTSIQVDKNGDFHAVLYQAFEGNISFYYSSGEGFVFKDLYISPGSATALSFDEKKIRAKKYSGAFVSSGKFSLTNRLINDFVTAKKRHHFKTPDAWPESNLNSDSLASYWNRRIKEELGFLHDYITKNKISGSSFKQWEENNIMYTGADHLAISLFSGRRDSTITYERYQSYFKHIPFDRPGALHNSSYYDFIKIFAPGLEIVENLNPAYSAEKKKNGNDIYPLALGQADQYSGGIARDLLYANLFSPKWFAQSNYAQRFYRKNVKDKFIQFAISKMAVEMTTPFAPYDVLTRLASYKVDDSLKIKFRDIFSKYMGKYLFVDFWGSWCGPCMQEIPVYPKFIKHFNADSVRFLFLSFEMTQKGVDEVQRKYGIAGDFILLSPNEMRVLNNVLGFEEYPRHFFIDPAGRVINNDIWEISSGDQPNKAAIEKLDDFMAKGAK